MRILVVDDELDLAEAIARRLAREGMTVDTAVDAVQAGAELAAAPYDVVVLDRDLPDLSGEHLCRAITADSSRGTKVLMVSASGDTADRVASLDLGADDYLTKPFAFAELAARVRALGRRTSAGPVLMAVLTHAGLVVDLARCTVTRDGRPISLTRKEFGVLEVLVRADGAVVSSEDLLNRVWGGHTDPRTTVLRVTMSSLRRKLGAPPLIRTVIGRGYRIA